jgi:hypothetical protein
MALKTIPELASPNLPLSGDELLEASQDSTSVHVSISQMEAAMSITPEWTYDSIIATTAGSSITLSSSIPTTALEIEILINGISTNTTGQPPIVRLGDAGGTETTGYTGVVRGPTGETSVTDGFYFFRNNAWNASDLLSGRMRLTRWDPNLHLWIADSLANDQSQSSTYTGRKTTSEVLTTIVLSTPGGVATFDAGSARVRYR